MKDSECEFEPIEETDNSTFSFYNNQEFLAS